MRYISIHVGEAALQLNNSIMNHILLETCLIHTCANLSIEFFVPMIDAFSKPVCQHLFNCENSVFNQIYLSHMLAQTLVINGEVYIEFYI